MENPIKMDDLGVPLFSETSIYVSLLRPCTILEIFSLPMQIKRDVMRPLFLCLSCFGHWSCIHAEISGGV